jgi:long-chain acyl-CoA synthetase
VAQRLRRAVGNETLRAAELRGLRRCRVAISSGAPIAPEILSSSASRRGDPEAYGLTGVAMTMQPGDESPAGTVAPYPGTEVAGR